MAVGTIPPARLPHFELVKLLAEASSLESAAPELVRVIARGFGWQAGALWLADPEWRVLEWADGWCASDAGLEAFTERSRGLTFPAGLGLPGRVWSAGEPAWLPDVTLDANFPRADVAAALGLHAGVALPVTGSRGVLGALEFFTTGVREPDEQVLEAMRTAGRQVGQYVERERAERRVREAEEHAAAIVSGAMDCIVLMDGHGIVRDFNPTAVATFGYPRETAIGRELAELLIPERLRDDHRRGLAACLRGEGGALLGRRVEMPALHADGHELPVELTITRLGTPAAPLFAGWLRDISRRRAAERERERLLAAERSARLAAEDAERRARVVSETLQRGLLPPRIGAPPGAEIAVVYRAGAAGTEVGGDFYDAFALDGGRWALALGDVRGKGLDAAAITSLARHTLRAAARYETGPADVLSVLNEALLRDRPAGDFCTAVFATLADGELTLALGGHPQPLRLSATGSVEPLGRAGTLLGAVPEPELHDATVALSAGDTVVFFTDGLIELRTADTTRLGADRLAALLAPCAGAPAGDVANRLVAATLDAPGHRSADDVAVLVLRIAA
jgi:phosphoserine phosphatase RsbU/P